MRVIKEGHVYGLNMLGLGPEKVVMDMTGEQCLQFVEMYEDGSYFNATTNEEVLKVLIDRMKYLNKKFPCRENSIVITKLEECLMWQNYRTQKRVEQGVEGKHEAHES